MRALLRGPSTLGPLLGLLPLFASACCGPPPSIKFQLDPNSQQEVNDGNTPTQVTAVLVLGGSPVPDGTTVTINLDPKSSASFAPIQAGAVNTTSTSATTSNGNATVQLYDLAVESVAVTASAQVTFQGDTSGNSTPMNGTVNVKFGGTCSDSFVTAPAASSGSQAGIATFISIQCNDATMGGSFGWEQNHPFEGDTQTCTAFVGDGPSNGIDSAAVQFVAEAGAFETAVQKSGQHATWLTNAAGEASLNYHVQPPYPEDVGYDQTMDGTFTDTNQPRMWTDQSGHVYNPRDGWVTLVAATAGKPPPGQAAPSEPYVDSNDNGQWDPGEPYIDVNCNGQFDQQQTPDANGYVRIWASSKILWTGQIYPNNGDTIDPGSIGIASGELSGLESPPSACGLLPASGSCTLVFRWVDKNLNFLSTQGQGNTLAYDATGGACSLTVNPASVGIDIQYEQLLTNPDYSVTVTNSATTTTGNAPMTVTATGTFNFADSSNPANQNLGKLTTIAFTQDFPSNCAHN
ncbi:MAG: hypothetical protein ACYCWW_10480 [Deltaproteobacteria bacterium]